MKLKSRVNLIHMRVLSEDVVQRIQNVSFNTSQQTLNVCYAHVKCMLLRRIRIHTIHIGSVSNELIFRFIPLTLIIYRYAVSMFSFQIVSACKFFAIFCNSEAIHILVQVHVIQLKSGYYVARPILHTEINYTF